MNPNDYFNLYDIFVNELIGDIWIAILICLIIIYLVSAKYNFPFQLSVLIGLLFLSIMYAITYLQIIWVVVLLIAGGFFYWQLAQKVNK